MDAFRGPGPTVGSYKLHGKRKIARYRRNSRKRKEEGEIDKSEEYCGIDPKEEEELDKLFGVKKKRKTTVVIRKPQYGEPGFIFPTTYEEHEDWDEYTIPDPSDVNIIARESWGASQAEGLEPLDTPVLRIALFYTGTEACFTRQQCVFAMRKLQQTFMTKRGLLDIPYNFLIGTDGNVYEGRGWDYKPTKVHKLYKYRAYKDLQNSIDIAYVGPTFGPLDDDRDEILYWPKSSFTVPMAHALRSLIETGIKANFVSNDFSLVSEIG